MTRPGLRTVQCRVCGQTRDLEAGIRTMYCCAQKMEEVEEEKPEGPKLTIDRR